METLGSRLRKARKAQGMKQSDLGTVIGESAATVSNWERDLNRPDVDKLIRICQVLNVPPAELLNCHVGPQPETLSAAESHLVHVFRTLDSAGRDLVRLVADHEYNRCSAQPKPTNVIPFPTRLLPLMDDVVSAGTGVALADEHAEMIWVPLTKESRRADYALQVRGDSMEPDYHDGDLLLVQKTDDVDPGELGIFVVNGDGLFKKRGKDCLLSLNPKYKPIKPTEADSVKTFGRVLGVTECVTDGGDDDDE